MAKVTCLRNCFVGGRLVEKGQVVEVSDNLEEPLAGIYKDPTLFSDGLEKKPAKETTDNGNSDSKSELRQSLEALAKQHGVTVTWNMKDESIIEKLKEKGIEIQ